MMRLCRLSPDRERRAAQAWGVYEGDSGVYGGATLALAPENLKERVVEEEEKRQRKQKREGEGVKRLTSTIAG